MALSFSVFNKFKAVDGVTAPVRKMEKSVGKFGKTSTKEFKRADRAAGKLSKSLKSMAKAAVISAALVTISVGLVDVIRKGVEFEQTIVNASAKFGEMAKRGTANFKALEDAAKKAGRTTEFAASEASSGLNFLAMAGFDVNQSIAALPGVIDLATASGLELSLATDIATDTLGAFNLATKDTIQLQKNLARVNDVLAKTTTSSNTNMEQLFEVFTEAGPVATSLGASIETVAAMAGTLANSGIKASQAGTTLKNVFVKLAAATPKAQKQLDKFGISVADSKGNFRDVFDILGDLNKSLSSLGDADRAAVLNDIFGKIPIAGVNILLSAGSDKLRAFRKDLEAAGGASATMAKMMRATTGVQLKIFMSTLESLELNIFAAMSDHLGFAIADFTELVRVASIWVAQNKGPIKNVLNGLFIMFGQVNSVIRFSIKSVSDLMEIWGPALSFIFTIIAALKLWAIAQGIVNTLMAANPLGLFIVALGAVTLGIKAVVDNWAILKDTVTGGKFWKHLIGFAGWVMKGGGTVQASPQTPISPNTGMINTLRQETTNKSVVDVNLKNVPQGSTVKQSSDVDGFNLNMGFAGAT